MVGCNVGKLMCSEINRILLFHESATNKSPESIMTAKAVGYRSSANAAGPPSPELPGVPVPAMVVMIPVLRITIRIVLLPKSAIKTFPKRRMDCVVS